MIVSLPHQYEFKQPGKPATTEFKEQKCPTNHQASVLILKIAIFHVGIFHEVGSIFRVGIFHELGAIFRVGIFHELGAIGWIRIYKIKKTPKLVNF